MQLGHNRLQQKITLPGVDFRIGLFNRLNQFRYTEEWVGPQTGKILNGTDWILKGRVVPDQVKGVGIAPF